MALINCPECGKEVSDKALKCPDCGYVLKEEEKIKIICPECGVELIGDEDKCPACGFPILKFKEEERRKKEHPIRNAIEKIGIKRIVFAIIAILALVIIVSIGLKEEEKEKAIKNRSEYLSTISMTQIEMLNGASESEDLINLVLSVWYNTIYEKSDFETDKYTKSKYGGFNSDFNTSLENLYADFGTTTTVSTIEESQDKVSNLMKKLQNPTEEFRNCYNTLNDLYVAYQGVTESAISPDGSYNSYSTKVREKIDEFVELFDKLSTQIPEE